MARKRKKRENPFKSGATKHVIIEYGLTRSGDADLSDRTYYGPYDDAPAVLSQMGAVRAGCVSAVSNSYDHPGDWGGWETLPDVAGPGDLGEPWAILKSGTIDEDPEYSRIFEIVECGLLK